MRPFFALRALLLLALLWPGVMAAADPFYNRRMDDGIAAHSRGDHPDAVRHLRLACFGLLDEPVALAECLTYLALAQAELGDEEAFLATFDRIMETERLFQAFSQAPLAADLRQAFEGHLERWAAVEVLQRQPIFRAVARRKLEAQIAIMEPQERRQQLERLLVAEPDHVPWRVSLAELDLAGGDFEAAFASAEEVLARSPLHPSALCIRGRAGAALGWCEQALADLDSCAASGEGSVAETRLRCYIALEDFTAGETLLTGIPPGARQRPPFKQLERTLIRGKKAAARRQDAAATTDGAEPEPGTASESPAPAMPPAVSAELERLAEVLRAGSRDELLEAFDQAAALANQVPQLEEPQLLTAEIAFRLSRWEDVVTYFERGGELDGSRPDRLFYLAVALYETGEKDAAKNTLERCLPLLEPTDYVQTYVDMIRDGGG